jgi:hypothetical protein
MDRFATAICRGTAPLAPAVILEAIEQARQGGALDAHALGNFFLGALVPTLRKVNERAPFALAQTERAQPLVELRPPGAGRAEKHKAKLINVWWRHLRKIG